MKFTPLILIGMFWSLLSHGQDQFSMEKYLAGALTDYSLEKYKSQLEFLGENNYNAPWLNRVEVRIGSDDANASLNEYRLRFSPTNPAEIKANKGYHQLHQKHLAARQDVALSEALKLRYYRIVSLFEIDNKKTRLDSLMSFQDKLINGLSRNSGIQTKDVIALQSQQTDLIIKQNTFEQELEQVKFNIQWDLNSNYPIASISNLISVDQIRNYISLNKDQQSNNALLTEAETDVDLLRQKLELERAESRSNIGYIQSNIDTERGDETSEHIGFQVGVRLPIVNPDKPKLTREKVELLEEEQELQDQVFLVKQMTAFNDMMIEQALDKYQIILDRISLASNLSSPTSFQQFDWKALFDAKKISI